MGDITSRESFTREEYFDAFHAYQDVLTDKFTLKRGSQRAVELLTDALHALRHGSPHITDEFIERAINHLVKASAEAVHYDNGGN